MKPPFRRRFRHIGFVDRRPVVAASLPTADAMLRDEVHATGVLSEPEVESAFDWRVLRDAEGHRGDQIDPAR